MPPPLLLLLLLLPPLPRLPIPLGLFISASLPLLRSSSRSTHRLDGSEDSLLALSDKLVLAARGEDPLKNTSPATSPPEETFVLEDADVDADEPPLVFSTIDPKSNFRLVGVKALAPTPRKSRVRAPPVGDFTRSANMRIDRSRASGSSSPRLGLPGTN